MTNREALLSLAERVEALSGPCRETDLAVFRAIGAPVPFQFASKMVALTYDDAEQCYFAPVGDMRVRYEPPAYTASIDSAMSLVGYQCGRPHNVVIATGHGSAYIVPNDGASYGVNDDLCVRGRASGDDEVGRTARAIVAASLRAIGEGL